MNSKQHWITLFLVPHHSLNYPNFSYWQNRNNKAPNTKVNLASLFYTKACHKIVCPERKGTVKIWKNTDVEFRLKLMWYMTFNINFGKNRCCIWLLTLVFRNRCRKRFRIHNFGHISTSILARTNVDNNFQHQFWNQCWKCLLSTTPGSTLVLEMMLKLF